MNSGPAALYQRAKQQKTYAGMPMLLYVRKGANAASFTAYCVSANKATLTMEQLEAVARIAASRL